MTAMRSKRDACFVIDFICFILFGLRFQKIDAWDFKAWQSMIRNGAVRYRIVSYPTLHYVRHSPPHEHLLVGFLWFPTPPLVMDSTVISRFELWPCLAIYCGHFRFLPKGALAADLLVPNSFHRGKPAFTPKWFKRVPISKSQHVLLSI